MSETQNPIGVIGDTHAHLGWTLGCIDAAAKAGVRTLISVGDFGLDFPGPQRGRLEKKVNQVLLERNMRLVISPGNHDNWETIEKLPVDKNGTSTFHTNIRILPRGGRTVVEGLIVGGLGGAYSIDQKHRSAGRDWWPDEAPTQQEADKLVAGGPVDVLITHDVPLSISMKSDLNLPSDVVAMANRTRLLLDRVIHELKPPNVFSGHWHRRLISELKLEDGSITRIDVLANELSIEGNAVLVWPGSSPLRIETMSVTTR
ncbi:metallophosphoesterase family protein [Arthrobacter sp. CAN_A1]|uniref:metallophosphoesterase family protein n=1 Tax=Arthrobacter sp. CAN_A1 TaxID=2787717 RepID=UPI0018C90334